MGIGEVEPFTLDDLAGMIGTAASSLLDGCIILRYSQGARDAHGKKVETWTPDLDEDSNPIVTPCGFGPPNRREANADSGQIQQADAVLRLAANQVITGYDRVKLVLKFGRPINPETYNVLGGPSAGPSALTVKLTRATND